MRIVIGEDLFLLREGLVRLLTAHGFEVVAAVADAVLRHLAIELLRLCPWALREGVVLRRLDVTPPGSSWPGLLATHG